MKPQFDDRIKTLIDIPADFSDRIIPKESLGTIVECYENPEGYAVDIALPNPHLVGGFEYENVVLTPQQFVVVVRAVGGIKLGI
jgi:hypothetical protein